MSVPHSLYAQAKLIADSLRHTESTCSVLQCSDMISSDNEQSRSRSTEGIIAKMYSVSTSFVPDEDLRDRNVVHFCNYSICRPAT